MKIGICADQVHARLLAADGCDYLEETVESFLDPAGPEEAFVRRHQQLRASGLPLLALNRFLPGSLKSVGVKADVPRLLAYADAVFHRAQAAGIGLIVFGSGASRHVPANFPRARATDQFVRLLRAMAPLAHQRGVTVLIEPLNRGECNFINSLAEGSAVVQAVSHPAVWLLADLYHMLQEGEAASEIVRHGALIRHCHAAEREDRAAPGTRGDDLTPFLRALRDISYSGALTLECNWRDLAVESARGLRAVRRAAERVGL